MLNAHNVLQRGAQGSGFGTANATATAKLQSVSNFALNPDLQTRALTQLRGTLAPTHQTVLDHYASNATFEVSDETYEDLTYWLDSLFSAATPDAPNYTRIYSAPTTAEVAPTFMTLQWGQANEVWQMQDASVTTLTMSGSTNSGLQVGGSLIGGKVIAGTLATLPDRTGLERMTGCQAAIAIDTWAGTMGGTAIASSAFSWELTVNANRQYRSYLGGCTPSAWNDQAWSGQLRLSLELNDTTDDQLIAMFAAANVILERQVQITYTLSTTHKLTIQFAGHSMSAPQLFTDRNGVMTYDLVLDGVYHPTFANWLKITTLTDLAKLV